MCSIPLVPSWGTRAPPPRARGGAAAPARRPPPPGRAAGLVSAADRPSADVFAALRGAAREIVVLLDAAQLPYLRRLAAPLDAVRLPGAADRAREIGKHTSELQSRLHLVCRLLL